MAKITTTFTLGATWTKVANAGDTVFVEAEMGGQVLRAFKATAPTGLVGHVVNTTDRQTFIAIADHMWMRAVDSAVVTVTTDGAGSGSGASGSTTIAALSATWTQIAATTNAFVEIECLDGEVLWRYFASAPTAGSTTGHLLRPGQSWSDTVNDSNVWVRSRSARPHNTATLVYSKG